MTALTVSLAALFALWMGWRGYRRGALATLVGRLPALAAVLVLAFMVRRGWAEPTHFTTLCLLGAVAAASLYAGGALAVRARRRARTASGRVAPRHGLVGRCNQAAGAVLGAVYAAGFVLILACAASMVPFALSVADEARPQAAHGPPPEWLGPLRQACCTIAALSDHSVLRHIPKLREYTREVRALILILNASREQLRHIAQKRGLIRLADLPEIGAALADEDYIDLTFRLRDGDLSALPSLVESPITHKLLTCPEIRKLAKTLTPSDLAKDLEEAPATAP